MTRYLTAPWTVTPDYVSGQSLPAWDVDPSPRRAVPQGPTDLSDRLEEPYLVYSKHSKTILNEVPLPGSAKATDAREADAQVPVPELRIPKGEPSGESRSPPRIFQSVSSLSRILAERPVPQESNSQNLRVRNHHGLDLRPIDRSTGP